MRNAKVSRRSILSAAVFIVLESVGQADASQTYVVHIKNMQFGMAPAELHVGDTLKWHNSDLFRHTATARDGSFDLDLPPGSEGMFTLTKAGDVEVFCRFHPMMRAQLTVIP